MVRGHPKTMRFSKGEGVRKVPEKNMHTYINRTMWGREGQKIPKIEPRSFWMLPKGGHQILKHKNLIFIVCRPKDNAVNLRVNYLSLRTIRRHP